MQLVEQAVQFVQTGTNKFDYYYPAHGSFPAIAMT